MGHLDERLEAAAGELRSAAVSLPERSWGHWAGERRGHLALAVVGAAVVALLIVGPLLWLRGGGGDHDDGAGSGTVETSAPDLTTLPPTTLPTTVTEPPGDDTTSSAVPRPGVEWASLGEAISDDEYHALFGADSEFDSALVSGSAVRLAWTAGYDGRYDLGLFAAQLTFGQGPEGVWYCLLEFGRASSDGGIEFGGSQCAPTLERFEETLSFGTGGGASCADPLAKIQSVWGVPESAEAVAFEMSDGTRLLGRVTSGIAQVAWGRDVQVTGITFEGVTDEEAVQLGSFLEANKGSCAELNDPGLSG